jgi:hypothetical protein
MNISTSVETNPALILLKSTIQAVTLSRAVAQQVSDSVNISDAAKQLAKAVAGSHS